jgi:putative addiction module component (TIGR02574 family)
MTAVRERILKDAMALSPAEREALAEDLVASLLPMDQDHVAAIVAEAEDRLAAYGAGESAAIPADEVMAKLRKKYGKSG